MRFLVSPEFTSKTSMLVDSDLQSISLFLNAVNSSSKEDLLDNSALKISILGDEVYISRVGQIQLYFTFGSDNNGEYLLLLDVITFRQERKSNRFFSTKDPRKNSLFNPSQNPTINPSRNPRINPSRNPMINPSRNPMINPSRNPMINPSRNPMINPNRNPMINPSRNPMINPSRNPTINPKSNRAYGGPYFYNSSLDQEGYIVRANDKVDIMFDFMGNQVGRLVEANDTVKVQFDANNNWNGYVVRANDDVLIRFSQSGEWIGILV